ncbi:MAG: hypothetical protein OHK0013_01780 [Sandaracinaceae bacterium]
MTTIPTRNRIVVYEDELERIGRHVVDRRRSETGGELYGLFTTSGSMVLHFVSGPGPRARHGETSFHQDRGFLRETFEYLNERHALQHLGSWHSHHGLSLAEPSGGDDATMVAALEASGLPAFLLVIANLVDEHGRPSHAGLPEVRAFLYRRDDPHRPIPCEWHILPGHSPVRVIDEGCTDTRPRADRAPTRAMPQATSHRTPSVSTDPTEPADDAPNPMLAHALRAAPWALTETGAAFVGTITDAFEVTSMCPSEVGELTLTLSSGALLFLGELEDEERLAGALMIETLGGIHIEDLTGPPATLVARVRRLLDEPRVESVSAAPAATRLSPQSASL